ncbi:MAG TPA: 2-oxo acid dehydrogenase subunit E2 [Polyangia bacterium]|nr:2-oxo acid dehydrogenase subunit E2 [Polyangia bacterium]
MSKTVDVLVPDIGDFHDVPVVEVLVSPGASIKRDDPIAILESDKASMDVPSPHAGVVEQVLVKVGDKVSAGARLATMVVADETTLVPAGDDGPAPAAPKLDRSGPWQPETPVPRGERGKAAPEVVRGPLPMASGVIMDLPTTDSARGGTRPSPTASIPLVVDQEKSQHHAAPAVRRLARELGVPLSEIRGTGRNDRIVEEDLRNYIKAVMARTPVAGGNNPPELPAVDFSKFGPIELRPLGRIRRATAVSVQRSWRLVPHVTQYDEADITDLEAFRKAEAEQAKQRGVRLTLLAFFMKATAATLKEHPSFNASLDASGENLVCKRYYHLGIAVDTPEGLVVPVLRDVDRKGIWELAGELSTLSQRAREQKLTPADVQGASFTISSLGGIGGTGFSPIVNAPEVAILGFSRASLRPICRDGQIVPRLILPFSLSYDHRANDGAQAARFTSHLRELLADIREVLL